jgi:outer membrane receptor protein involved in Fe transport
MGRFQELLLGSAAAMVMTAPAWAGDPAQAQTNLKISAGPLDAAILSLAAQSQVRILFSRDLVVGKRAAKLEGRYSAYEALDQLLAGSGIEVDTAKPGVLILRATRLPVSTAPRPQVPRVEASPRQAPAAAAPRIEAAQSPDAVTELSEIVVGSHIRGVKQGASPVIVLDRAEIDRGGYATVADALTAVPQAFGGTTSDDTGTTSSDPTTTNGNRATAINLRGLGADATLVLINGRRMAGAGLMGDFADISSIPLAAVARIEVLLDGASALYGSDAVGGVVNVVMRERYEGSETRARIGGSTRGDLGQRQIAHTFGRGWSNGSILLSGEYQRRNMLMASSRAYTADADLRSLGGTDHPLYFSQPATILGVDPVTFAFTPAYAVPAGQDGTNLRPSDFIPGKNLANWRKPMSLLPTQERGSLYVAASQEAGAFVTLTADARYSDRRYYDYSIAPQTTLTVGRNNPYFVSPNGSASHYVAYSFLNETTGLKSVGEVQSRGLSFGAKVRLPHDWRLDAYVLHAEELGTSRYTTMLNSTFLNEALGNTPDNPATAYNAPRDGYFNPFIGAGRNKQAVLDFVTSGWETRRTVGRLDTASVMADGTLFRLPAGAVRLAVGAQLREENLKTIGLSAASSVTPIPNFSRYGDRTVSALFAEGRVPLFGPDNRRPGLERLDLSMAVRREHYQGGATSTVPKLGLLWSPVSDWSLKATYGESFRAPSLGEITDPQRVTPVNISAGASGTVLTLLRYGGNPNLAPETAKSWTTGLEYAPAALPQVRINATLWNTEFKGRIGQPAINNLSTVLTAPDLAPFRQFISPATNPAELALVKDLLKGATASTASLYAPEAYGAIADARYVNTGDFKVRGLDLTGSYGLSVRGDPLVITGNLSWLMSYERRITAVAKGVELAGMAEYPADLRGRVSATWTHGAYNVTTILNHVGDLHTAAGVRIPSQTTADLQVEYRPSAVSGPLKGLSLALTVQNLFDSDPPFYDSPAGVGYDPANYDPSGRVVALQLTKAW